MRIGVKGEAGVQKCHLGMDQEGERVPPSCVPVLRVMGKLGFRRKKLYNRTMGEFRPYAIRR